MMNKKLKKQKLWDRDFIEIAKIISEHSTCCRKKVGCVIVKDRRIISTGYNGTPSGMKHCNERFKIKDIESPIFMELHHKFATKYEIHAEQNAIAELSKNGVSGVGATTTLAPCSMCSKLIAAAGIKRVVYLYDYDRDMSGPEFLKEYKLKIEKFGE